MKNLLLVTLIFLCAAPTLYAQDTLTLSQDDLNNADLMKVLNNYFGCKTWVDGVCTECSQSYFFNAKGICCLASQECQVFNKNAGICERCYQGYGVVDGKCVAVDLVNGKDKGCNKWANGVCAQCSARWYFDANKVCQPVDDNCRTWSNAGACQTCYNGYVVSGNACIRDANEFAPAKDSLCAQWKDRVCLKCAPRAYFDQSGVCVGVSDYCNTWDQYEGVCLTCYKGYNLNSGVCAPAPIAGPKDLGCKRWDWDNQVCLECSARWTKGADGACVPVSDACSTWGANGACTACYKGYNLSNGVCTAAELKGPTDLGCKRWDWDNQKCLECSARWTMGASGVCVAVNDACSTWGADGACTACYKGYHLQNAVCVLAPVTGPTDLGCKRWDWDNQVCLECSARWTKGANGVCVPVSDSCATWGADGICTACYKGYNLKDGACVLADLHGPTDLGCKRWDWDNQKCLECSARWTMGANGVCVAVNDACSTWGADGACTACYKGYNLKDGACVLADLHGPTDLGCKRWDWDNQKCLECSARWTMGANGVCVAVNDVCAAWGADGICTACYKGYSLNNGVCVLADLHGPTDLGCKRWDWDNQKCLECSARWTMGANGVCVAVSDACSTWGADGACTACYKGYNLLNGACVVADLHGPTDLGCKRWDWDNQVCLECSARWVKGANGVCVPVSDVCATWGADGICTACYKGYNLSNGVCVLADLHGPTDLGCKRWDWDNQKCLECSARWTMGANGVCVAVNDACSTWGADGACTACYKGYNLNNGVCVLAPVTGPKDLGCKNWDWDNQKCLECSARWAFGSNGVCVPVSDYCSAFDKSGVCTACYNGYALANGQCQVQNVLCKVAKADGTCQSCYNGYVLYREQCIPISKLASIAQYYAACCPEKLAALQKQGRIN